LAHKKKKKKKRKEKKKKYFSHAKISQDITRERESRTRHFKRKK
jgi:hypothetical protein